MALWLFAEECNRGWRRPISAQVFPCLASLLNHTTSHWNSWPQYYRSPCIHSYLLGFVPFLRAYSPLEEGLQDLFYAPRGCEVWQWNFWQSRWEILGMHRLYIVIFFLKKMNNNSPENHLFQYLSRTTHWWEYQWPSNHQDRLLVSFGSLCSIPIPSKKESLPENSNFVHHNIIIEDSRTYYFLI